MHRSVSNSFESSQNSLNVHNLNLGTAYVFTPASIAGASEQLKESMLGIAKKSAQLECLKLQQKIVEETQHINREKAERAARARVRAEMAAQKPKGGNPKRVKKDLVAPGDGGFEEKAKNTFSSKVCCGRYITVHHNK